MFFKSKWNSEDVSDEYIKDYKESGAEDYGISYEDYALNKTMRDYGMTTLEMDSGDED